MPTRSAPRESRTAYAQQVDGLLGCLATIFRPLVEQAHGTFGKVRHTYFGSAIDTPCGRESGAYAFYCEANATIYLSQAVYDGAHYGRLSVSDTVIHEYGHHVQAMMGAFDAAEHLSEARAVAVRREELQVFCWTYYVFASVPTFDLTVRTAPSSATSGRTPRTPRATELGQGAAILGSAGSPGAGTSVPATPGRHQGPGALTFDEERPCRKLRT